MLRQSTAPPRGPRPGGSSTTRNGGRGGIQKRRAGSAPVRVDKDGDLVMDPAATGDKHRSGKGRIEGTISKPLDTRRTNSGPNRGGSAGMQRAQAAILRGIGAQQANLLEARITTPGTTLKVEGLKLSKAAGNPDGGLESLLAFLERKAKAHDNNPNRVIKIKKSSMKGDSVIISASPEDIVEIQKLDKYTFAGATLSISPCDSKVAAKVLEKEKKVKDTVSTETAQLKEQFKAILASRYDVALKLLNLSDLAHDAGLQKMGIFDGTTNTSKVFPALMAVCDGLFNSRKEKREAIITVTLTDNNLTNVSEVTALAETFPDIKNIDLSRNNLVSPKSIESWQRQFRSLENLVLSHNPVEAQLPTLKDEILKWYPNLRTINGVQLRTGEELASSLAIASDPIPISGPDFRDVDRVGENFIRQFLPLYDNDRQALLTAFYDSQSVFTVSVNNASPHSNQVIPAWADYTKYSRNLVKITNLPTRMSRQYRGIQAISPVWSSLPKTQHPDIASQGNKYIVECHPLPGLPDPTGQSSRGVDGLIITMHGEFEEAPTAVASKPVRSFSRTFILGPGGPGGPPIRVISDMLTVRAWGVLSSPHAASQPIDNTEQQAQESLAMQLMEKTGMTLQYAGMCLMETGWNLEQAFAVFTANKDKLPAEAFIASAAR